MADRFPSIEDIDAGDTDVHSGEAPKGDFLSRERAALGEDADLFTTQDTKHATIEDGDGDLLGGDDDFGPAQTSATADELNDFESSFPAVSTQNDNVGPGGSITNTTQGYTNYQPTTSSTTNEDTEPIRAWRTQRDADLTRRDEASARKKAETVATAQKDIDSFYETYNRKVDRQKTQTQKEAEEFLAKREDTTAGGTSWERIAKLVDISGSGAGGKGVDKDGSNNKKKMRDMLVALSKDKDAPGASGI